MKKTRTTLFIIITMLIFFISCDFKSNELSENLNKLKSENIILNDSIQKLNNKLLTSLKLKTNFTDQFLELNKKNIIQGHFQYFNYLPNYKVFLRSNTEDNKVLVYEGIEPNFNIEYTPKSKNDSILYITTESDFNSEAVIFYSELPIKFK